MIPIVSVKALLPTRAEAMSTAPSIRAIPTIGLFPRAAIRLRLVSIPHCNYHKDQIVMKCFKLYYTLCLRSFRKSNLFTYTQPERFEVEINNKLCSLMRS